jgi:hypothetical protein
MTHVRKRTNLGKGTRIKMCGSEVKPKARLSESYARKVVARRIAQGAFPGSVRAYGCPWCGFWHTGTAVPAELRHRRRGGGR